MGDVPGRRTGQAPPQPGIPIQVSLGLNSNDSVREYLFRCLLDYHHLSMRC
jgi:hypothetical protein